MSDQGNPGDSSNAQGTQPNYDELREDMIEVTITSMMTQSDSAPMKVSVSRKWSMTRVKIEIADKLDIPVNQQLLFYNDVQLTDEKASLQSYNVPNGATLKLHIKLSAGTNTPQSVSSRDIILLVPEIFPVQSNVGALRDMIRVMHNPRSKKKSKHRQKRNPVESSRSLTPEIKMENELTRNKMKALLRKRKERKDSQHSIVSPYDSGASTPDLGSIMGSPMCSEPPTPPEAVSPGLATGVKGSDLSQALSKINTVEKPVTEEELKLFFDPVESQVEHENMRTDLHPVASSYEEHKKMMDSLEKEQKKRCKFCRCRLKGSEQAMFCACGVAFCRRHRDPDKHNCPIDYKQLGREKISKENQKVSSGGLHKGKAE